MKKKWTIVALVVGLIGSIIVVAMVWLLPEKPSSGAEQNETTRTSFMDDCWERVTNMNIKKLDDGTVEVTLIAPDYNSLVKKFTDDNKDTITGEYIAKAANDNPECVKEYTFSASSSAETDVRDALMEQISYELVALTLQDIIGG